MFTENLDAFFAQKGFVHAATLSGQAVSGVFDDGYELTPMGSAGAASAALVFVLKDSDAGSDPQGLTLVVAGVSYTVMAFEPDGTGVTRLILERVL